MVAILSARSALLYKSDMPMAPRPMLETVVPCFPRVRLVTVRFNVTFLWSCDCELLIPSCRAHPPERAGHVDDRTARAHPRQNVLEAEEYAAHVDRHDAVKILFGNIFNGSDGHLNAGHIDEALDFPPADVERWRCRDRLMRQLL